MKKFILPIALSLLFFTHSQIASAAGCDENFYGTLRAGNAFNFFDDMTNQTGNPVFVNLVGWSFNPQYNYGTPPSFSESSLVSDSHIWNPGETGRIINSSTYSIDSHPPVRSNDNLVIKYDVTFSQKIN